MSRRRIILRLQLIDRISLERDRIDAIICSSRNGANIANVIGWLLKLKVVYCMNLGPKFAMITNSLENQIRTNKRYIYIFDFICLGTEVKVLNALLGMKNAELTLGWGIANYVSFDIGGNNANVLGRMNTLVDLKKERIPYKIAGTEEEVKKLLVKEKEKNESRLFEV